MSRNSLHLITYLIVVINLAAEERVLFFDDFNTVASYHEELTPNATTKVYKTNSLPEGHLLKKWNYSWDYLHLEGDWKQAFYVVPEGKQYMEQAGRSGSFGGAAPYRITAKAEIPLDAKRYAIELKQYKSDNDPVLYVLGANIKGQNGVEIGFQNQLPGTDETVQDAYLTGTIAEGVFKENMAFRRTWVDIRIEVNTESKLINWIVNDQTMLTAYAADLNPGGYFGIYMKYERGTKFDDVRITIHE